ncbi:hypothetical protein Aduo_004501 [Ancylostoma duodenale]
MPMTMRRMRRQCLLRLLKENRVVIICCSRWNLSSVRTRSNRSETRRKRSGKVQQLRGTLTTLAKVHELLNDKQHAVLVAERSTREWFIPTLSIVDKNLLHLNALVTVKASGMFKNVTTAIVGLLSYTTDSSVLGRKLDKPPKETFVDIGGLENHIREMEESVELSLTHPEYGHHRFKRRYPLCRAWHSENPVSQGCRKFHSCDVYQSNWRRFGAKQSGDGAKLVSELFKMAKNIGLSMVFLDEADAVGTKRYDTSSRT